MSHQKNGNVAKATKNPNSLQIVERVLFFFVAFVVGLFIRSIYFQSPKTTSPTVTQNVTKWTPFIFQEGNFKILFPLPNPNKTSDIKTPIQEIDSSSRHVQFCENDSTGYSYCAEVGIYPPSFNLQNNSSNLEEYKNIILSNYKNPTVVSSANGQIFGFPSSDFVLKNNASYIKYRIFSIEDNSYALSIGSPNTNFPTFEKFVDSFSVLKLKYNNGLNWQPLSSTDWNFQTVFPSDNLTTTVTSPNDQVSSGITYTSKPNGRETYSIVISKWRAEKSLRSLLDDTITYLSKKLSISYKIQSVQNSTCSNNPCLIFLAEEADSKGSDLFKGVDISVDNTIYSIYGLVDNQQYFQNIDKITGSFLLTR